MKLSREQLRGIMFYEFKGNVSAAECYRNLCDPLELNIVTLCTVEKWFSGREILYLEKLLGVVDLLLMMICVTQLKKITVLQLESLMHSSEFIIQQLFVL